MNSWHTVKVKYTKQLQDGTLKRVTEPYLVNSISFTDAEARIHQEIGEFVRGEFLVTSIAKTDFADIFHYDDADIWYKAKVQYVSEDLDSGKEKKVSNNFLISAHNVKEAYERIEESLKGLQVDFDIPAIAITPILEIFPYVAMEGEELVPEDAYEKEEDDTSSSINVAYVAPDEEE